MLLKVNNKSTALLAVAEQMDFNKQMDFRMRTNGFQNFNTIIVV
jgi:hypothetical protein